LAKPKQKANAGPKAVCPF